jgi:hypothetical protein
VGSFAAWLFQNQATKLRMKNVSRKKSRVLPDTARFLILSHVTFFETRFSYATLLLGGRFCRVAFSKPSNKVAYEKRV